MECASDSEKLTINWPEIFSVGSRFSTADSLGGCHIKKLLLYKQVDENCFSSVNKYLQLIPLSTWELKSVEILMKVLWNYQFAS